TAEVEELNVFYGTIEEGRAQSGEFFHGVGREEFAGGSGGGCGSWRPVLGKHLLDCARGGLRGVDDVCSGTKRAERFGNQRRDQRVVRAAEDDDLRRTYVEGLAQVDAQDVSCDLMVDPALLDEWHEEGAGFFHRAQADCGAGVAIGVRLHGGSSG